MGTEAAPLRGPSGAAEVTLEEAIRGRRTIRRFQPTPVPRELLHEIIERGIWAPSSCNRQRWEFILVDDPELKRRLSVEARNKYLKEIPAIMFVLYDRRVNPERFSNIQAAGAAVQNILLAAHARGVATWWMAGYGDEEKVREVLSIPPQLMVLSAVGFGYAQEQVEVPKRRDVDEVLHLNAFRRENVLSDDPAEWTFEQLADFSALSVFAKSPFIGYPPFFPREFRKEVKFVRARLPPGRVLVYLEFTGNHTFSLAKALPNRAIEAYTLASEVSAWLQERADHLGLSNVAFLSGPPKTDFPDGSFDAVVCPQSVNSVPDPALLLQEARRLLKPGGVLLLSAVSSRSFHGLYSKGKGRIIRTAPVKAMAPARIRSLISDAGFEVKETRGINLFPGPEIVTAKEGVVGEARLARLRPLLKILSLNGKTEGIATKGPLKAICRLHVMACKRATGPE